MNQKKIIAAYVIGVVALLGLIVWVAQRGKAPTSTDELTKILTVASDEWTKGGKYAPATLIEYSDFQCPACESYEPILAAMTEQFGNDLRLVYRHLPLTSVHQNALAAAKAAEAAGRQGKFWEMHDMLFAKQNEWSEDSSADGIFVTYAKNLNLDESKFQTDYASTEVQNKIQEDITSAQALGLTGTPSFFLNGKPIQNPRTAQDLAALIEAAIKDTPPPEVTPDDLTNAPDTHEHADIAVYVNNKKIDFTANKYQADELSSSTAAKDETDEPYVHFHDGNGSVVHLHKERVPLGYFFQSIGLKITDSCLTLDTGTNYCTSASSSLKFFVNGKRETRVEKYQFKDNDRLLITYGPLVDPRLDTQLKSVTQDACIYSETCPDRGKPPKEKCVGGPGTKCEGK